jgi:hypothetical protein
MQQPDFFKAWTEPESAANTDYQPVYPYNNVTATPSGHTFELDDTPTRERIRLQHRSGTFIEMHPNGDEVHKVYGSGFEITIKDKNVLISGNVNVTIEGDSYLHVVGDKIEQIDGNVEQHIKGNYTQIVEGISSVTSQGDYNIICGGLLGGGLKVQTGDYMYLTGDLCVDGEIVSDKITSTGRIDAGTGISAGILGFVTVEGGLSVGIPAAVPSEINSAGPINSLASVSAPMGDFGVMSATLSYDIINTLLYDMHVHPIPTGVTGPTPNVFVE